MEERKGERGRPKRDISTIRQKNEDVLVGLGPSELVEFSTILQLGAKPAYCTRT
jgi:hypothetical protein